MPFTPSDIDTSPAGFWLRKGKKTPSARRSRPSYFSITSG
jgi:hypothetical protein